jgi:hypothetical protein
MNTVTTFESETTDDSFPYVLVSSLAGTLVSLAAAWIWTAAALGPLAGA